MMEERAQEARLARMETLVLKGLRVKLEGRVLLGQRETLAQVAHRATRADEDPWDLRAKVVPREILDQPGQLDPLVPEEAEDQVGVPVTRDRVVLLESRAHQAERDISVLEAQEGRAETMDLLGPRGLQAQEGVPALLDQRGLLARQDQRDRLDKKAMLGWLETLGLLDLLALLAARAPLGPRVGKGPQARVGTAVLVARLALVGSQAKRARKETLAERGQRATRANLGREAREAKVVRLALLERPA